MTHDTIYIYGKHALVEALTNAPRSVRKVFLAKTMEDPKLRSLIAAAKISVSILSGNTTPSGVESDASHQGVIGLLSLDGLVRPYKNFAEKLAVTPDTSLVLLNELHDPHNVGAIIRSAAAFGVSGVLIPEHNQAPITGTVVKVSAGMAFRVPLVAIGNVNHTIEDLKKRGFWVYGLAGDGPHSAGEAEASPRPTSLAEEQFTHPSVFILGNESKGIREKTREHCDHLLSVSMHPDCESLNVAASTAVALYAWSSQHPGALERRGGLVEK